MGIKGTVRRSVDINFIHTNIDIDLIITEEPEYGRPDKPEEIFHIIEHFCLGKRRLYLFGRDSTIRPGWLTIGTDLSESNFDKVKFKECIDNDTTANLTGSSERIDMLRPKTPPLKAKQIALNALSQQPLLNPTQIPVNPSTVNNQIIKPILPEPNQLHPETGGLYDFEMTKSNFHEGQVFNYNNITSTNEIQPNQFNFNQ